ncbi:MAG: VWA domain-containing protein [Deltaproteobacteria bacterium]|nr:VWA domain-containing protein [Nannocystaceae bacterium]
MAGWDAWRVWVAGALLVACGRTGLFAESGNDSQADTGQAPTDGPGQTDTGAPSSSESSSTTMLIECDEDTGTCPIELRLRRAVDILFVVDNSGSMGGEQATLARSFRSFVEVLEAQQVGANYRIGVTTTAGDGLLRATSCRERLNDFLFEWTFGTLDERQRGCLDHCAIESLALADPWVEKSEGTTNLPPGIAIADALQCVGPPGINGPGFERPLEGMYQVITNDTAGFLRDDALLAVIFLTDEADCSATIENQSWLQASGDVFWEPGSQSTSASCWNAGVTCTGGPGVYDDCLAVDKGFDGFPTDDPDEAVLFPTDRYVDVLTELAIQRQASGGQGQVLLSLIAGVPLDYPETEVIQYADSQFDDFNVQYGIGPACNIGSETVNDPPGIPDVRLRKVVESFAGGEPTVFSVCSDDYSIALESIAGAIGEISERACVIGCVADLAPEQGVQPSCQLVEQFPVDLDEPDRLVQACQIDGDSWDFPGPLVDVCYRVLDDLDQSTPQLVDDMTTHCSTQEFNLELLVERRPGVPVPSGTSIAVDCDLLGQPGVKCEDV